jgi:hypothetical protein
VPKARNARMHFNPTIDLASIESKQVPVMPCKKALT